MKKAKKNILLNIEKLMAWQNDVYSQFVKYTHRELTLIFLLKQPRFELVNPLSRVGYDPSQDLVVLT